MIRLHHIPVFAILLIGENLGWATDAPVERDDVDPHLRYGPRRIEIVFDENDPVKVRVAYSLRNLSSDRRQTKHQIPVLISRPWGQQEPVFNVRLNDERIQVSVKPLDTPADYLLDGFSRTSHAAFSDEEVASWPRRLEEWAQRDPVLTTLLARSQELRQQRAASNKLYEQFYREIDRRLIHDRECRWAALRVATGQTDLSALVQLMPEVDPSLRFDIDDYHLKYISYLDVHHPQNYSAYEAEWTQKVEAWLLSMPSMTELIPRLRQDRERAAQLFQTMNHEIGRHLHDQCGLSLKHSQQLAQYFSASPPPGRPPREVIEHLFPEVRQQREAYDAEARRLLNRWGIDAKQVSTLTGRLYHATEYRSQRPSAFGGDRPTFQEVVAAIKRGENLPVPSDEFPPLLNHPFLVSFDLSIAGNGTSAIVMEYETRVSPQAVSTPAGPPAGPTEIVAVVPPEARQTTTDVTVVTPPKFHPVISPAPDKVQTDQEGRRHYTMHREHLQQNVHLRLFDFQAENVNSLGILTRLSLLGPRHPDDEVPELLQLLRDKIENLTVRPLLLAVQSLIPDRVGNVAAYEAYLQLVKEDSEFAALPQLHKELTEFYGVPAVYNWVKQKSRSPVFIDDDDFRRVGRSSDQSDDPLHPRDFEFLVTHVQALDVAELSVVEKLGRHFVLCEARIDPRENLAAILQIAEADDEAVIPALRLIGGLSIEKPQALPFVLKHVGLKTLPPRDPGRLRQYTATIALFSFRSPKIAQPLIEFIGSTEDSYFIQTAVDVVSEMSLPALFNDLVAIADRVADSSESAFYNYRDLLIQSNPDAAPAILEELYRKYPNYAPRDRMPREEAIATYQSSDDKERIQSAVLSLLALGDSAVITELNYREGLEEWTNNRLLSLVTRQRGFREAFPFVESFYDEFVKDSRQGSPYECIHAFEATGDPRAIPPLKEIVRTHERKTDAAHAIGALMLEQYQPYSYDEAQAELINLIHKLDRPAKIDAAAWEQLLEDPESSLTLIMRFSRIRDLVSDQSPAEWQTQDRERFQYLKPFGTLAARQLLAQSRNASLQVRYNIAHLLSALPPEIYDLLRETAGDPDANDETRRASIQALGLAGDADSVAALADLLADKAYRTNAIEALAKIGTKRAQDALRRLKDQLEAEDRPTLQQEVWLSKIEGALERLR